MENYRLCIIFFTIFCIKFNESRSFCYDQNDPHCAPKSDEWSKVCHEGKAQSPIDIPFVSRRTWNILSFGPRKIISFDSSYMNGTQSAFIKNNGHTVQISIRKDLKSSMVLQTSEFPDPYIFSQTHCHWASEHRISSRRFPLECHFVHYNARYESPNEAMASGQPGSLLIIGILYENERRTIIRRGLVRPNVLNKPMEAFTKNLRQVKRMGNETISIQSEVNIFKMLMNPNHIDLTRTRTRRRSMDMYRYTGSLTTPHCNEGMNWLMMRRIQTLSNAQMRQFRAVLGEGDVAIQGNYRQPQPLNGRKVTPIRLQLAPLLNN